MNSTFTWAMPNKSILVLPITWNFKKLFIVIKSLAKSLIVYDPLRGFAKDFITMNSFWKFYVMGSPEIDLFGIAHVKVEFIPVLKKYTVLILGKFVWSTHFVQCDPLCKIIWSQCLFLTSCIAIRNNFASRTTLSI